MKISLSLPYKPERIGGRMDHLSWIEKADNPENIELIYAVDEPYDPPELPCIQKVIICDNHGSFMLRNYHNEIAKLAEGDVIQVLADDCEMLTQGWDTILASKDYLVSQMSGKVSYPSVRKETWLQLFGCLCKHSVDSWIHYVSNGYSTQFPEIKLKQYMEDNASDFRNDVNKRINKSFHSKENYSLIEKDRLKLIDWINNGTI